MVGCETEPKWCPYIPFDVNQKKAPRGKELLSSPPVGVFFFFFEDQEKVDGGWEEKFPYFTTNFDQMRVVGHRLWLENFVTWRILVERGLSAWEHIVEMVHLFQRIVCTHFNVTRTTMCSPIFEANTAFVLPYAGILL